MPYINMVVLCGHATRDAEVKSLSTGMTVASFCLAINEKRKDKDHVGFFDVTTFGNTADWYARHVKKGDGVTVAGRLDYQTWEKDGQKRTAIKVIADRVVISKPKDKKEQGDDVPPPPSDDDGVPF